MSVKEKVEEKPKTAKKVAEKKDQIEKDQKVETGEKPRDNSMKALFEKLGDNILPYKEGELVEATILAVGGNRIWVDVAGQSLGFVPEREITSKTGLKKGDKIFASVILMENEDGHVVLSMRQADREKYWQEMEVKAKSGEVVSVEITDANKGGLISEIGGIQGFLPVSQLTAEHYPRVAGGDKEEILNRLRQFIGTSILCRVINCDKDGNKLIFSEKAVSADEVKIKVDKFAVGDKVAGKITGIVEFGLFVKIDTQIEGLVHISEISWSRVTDLHKIYKVGDNVSATIIGIDNGKISLSIKRLLNDPWVQAASKFKVGTTVLGEVTKITPFGAFVTLGEGIDGLVHVSELSNEHIVDPGQSVTLGKEYNFKIISIEPESHRLGLSLKEAEQKKLPVSTEKSNRDK